MVLDDNDPEKWVYDEHTKAKHEVLSKYITPWTFKLSRYNKRAANKNKLRIFDCFAGRGYYVDSNNISGFELPNLDIQIEYPGSPLIILDRVLEHESKFDYFDLILMEKNDDNFEHLKNVLNDINVPEKVNISIIPGDYRESITKQITKTGGQKFPTLFFLDPFGFKALEYNLISNLVSTRLFETLITFMSRDMNRFLNSEKHEESLNNVFKNEEWRDKVNDYDEENWEALVDYYVNLLSEAGAKHHFEYMICEPDSKKTIYYLVHTSNNIEGKRTFREVTHRCGTGKFAYAPRKPEHNRKQKMLFGGGKKFLKNEVLPEYKEYRIQWTNLCKKVIEGESAYEDFNESDLRDALKELEDESKITIERNSSKEDGIKDEDLIDFRGW